MNHCRWTKILSIGDEVAGVDKGRARTRGITPETSRATYGGAKPAPHIRRHSRRDRLANLESGESSKGRDHIRRHRRRDRLATLKAARVLNEEITSGGIAVPMDSPANLEGGESSKGSGSLPAAKPSRPFTLISKASSFQSVRFLFCS
jgi:hypothetical protein